MKGAEAVALACAVALEVLRVLDREGLVARAARLGEYFLAGLRRLQSRRSAVKEAGEAKIDGRQIIRLNRAC